MSFEKASSFTVLRNTMHSVPVSTVCHHCDFKKRSRSLAVEYIIKTLKYRVHHTITKVDTDDNAQEDP